MPYSPRPVQKVLVIRFSSIGDIVLTTPVLRGLKQQLGAEVHFLTKKAYGPILKANPYVDALHTITSDIGEVLPELKAIRFDFVVDLHHNLRSWRVKRALGVPGASFPKLNWEKWLLVRFKIRQLPEIHIVDRYLYAARALGVVNDGEGLDYFIPPDEEVDARSYVRDGRFAVLVIGAAHATKRLPDEQLAAVCRALSLPVLLLGGPADRETGRLVEERAGAHVQNLCGELSLNQSASLVKQAAVVISHDTGLMHIAAAFRKPIVSVWGNTVPAFGMTPFYPDGVSVHQLAEVEGLSCRPCSKIGFDACPKGHFHCMKMQDPGDIARKAVQLLPETNL
ncbi:MAG: glycosyltransferase family 9 protein [Saprospirales bacterium]|nr:glycosyltransferase family 9 protein [Saprospirales bacterium]